MIEITNLQQADKYLSERIVIRHHDNSCSIGLLICGGWLDANLNVHLLDFTKSRVFLIPQYK